MDFVSLNHYSSYHHKDPISNKVSVKKKKKIKETSILLAENLPNV